MERVEIREGVGNTSRCPVLLIHDLSGFWFRRREPPLFFVYRQQQQPARWENGNLASFARFPMMSLRLFRRRILESFGGTSTRLIRGTALLAVGIDAMRMSTSST